MDIASPVKFCMLVRKTKANLGIAFSGRSHSVELSHYLVFGVRGETVRHSIVSVRSVKIQVLVSSFKVN